MSAKEIGGGVPSNVTPAGRPEFDVGFASDTSSWAPYQKLVLLLCSLVIVLDGFDALALGFAAPAMLPDLNLTKEELAPVLAIGLIGMTIGAAIGGILGDKFGRKIALLVSTIIFGSMTGAIAFANDLPTLGLFRFIAGIGLGGALPNVTALVAEYTPSTVAVLRLLLVWFAWRSAECSAGLFLPKRFRHWAGGDCSLWRAPYRWCWHWRCFCCYRNLRDFW